MRVRIYLGATAGTGDRLLVGLTDSSTAASEPGILACMSALQVDSPVESPETRIPIFQTTETLERHRLITTPWPRPMCMERFIIGTVLDGQVKDITCERCLNWYTPDTFEVRVPDRRYKSGYRVVHRAVGDEESAQQLAEQTGNKDASVVAMSGPTKGSEPVD